MEPAPKVIGADLNVCRWEGNRSNLYHHFSETIPPLATIRTNSGKPSSIPPPQIATSSFVRGGTARKGETVKLRQVDPTCLSRHRRNRQLCSLMGCFPHRLPLPRKKPGPHQTGRNEEPC